MWLYASALTVLAIVSLWATLSLVRMRREAQRRMAAIRAYQQSAAEYAEQSALIYDMVIRMYADAAGWQYAEPQTKRMH